MKRPTIPPGQVVEHNGRVYLVTALTVYVGRARGNGGTAWWQRLNPRGPTATAVRKLVSDTETMSKDT